MATVALIGASIYLGYWAKFAPTFVLQPGFGATALYRWFGYHRVAPLEDHGSQNG
jgi:hypothetical protein